MLPSSSPLNLEPRTATERFTRRGRAFRLNLFSSSSSPSRPTELVDQRLGVPTCELLPANRRENPAPAAPFEEIGARPVSMNSPYWLRPSMMSVTVTLEFSATMAASDVYEAE